MSIYVVKLTVYDKLASIARTILLCTASGYATKPTDTPPNHEAFGTILTPALLTRSIADQGLLTGASSIGEFSLVIGNEYGDLDDFAHYAVDNGECVIMVADDETKAYPAEYTLICNGTMEQAIYNDAEVTILGRTVEFFAVKPLQDLLYAGNNVGSVGLEGSGANVQGTPKVLVFGRALNMVPVPVNPVLLIDQWHNGIVRDVPVLYDKGGTIPADPAGDYADETELQTVQPRRGYFRKLKAGGYTRRGSGAVGVITGDVWEGRWPDDRTTAQIFKRIAITYGGLDPSQVSDEDIAAFDLLQPGLIGLDFKQPVTVGEALDAAIKGQGGVRFSDNHGVLRLKRLDAPTGTPVATFSDDGDDADGTILAFSRERFGDNDAGVPVRQVIASGVPFSEVQEADGLIGSVGTARRARVSQRYLTRTAEDASVLVAHKGARVLQVITRLMCADDLQAEADRLLALFKVRRSRFEVTLSASFDVLSSIDITDVVALKRTRYGMANTLCRVLGITLDPARNELRCTLWGES